MPRTSLTKRVLWGAGAVLASLAVIAFYVVQGYARHAADEAFDRVLIAATYTIAETVEGYDSGISIDLPYSAFAILGTSKLNRVFYRVTDHTGRLLTGSATLGLEIPLATGSETRLYDSLYRGQPIRVVAVSKYYETKQQSGWINILVGETREAREALAAELTRTTILPVVTVAIIAFFLIWLAVRIGFAPLRKLELSIRARTSSNLSPLDGDIPREVFALVDGFNEFLARLSATLDGLKSVTTDAAHQFRTPLTAIRSQAEVALDDCNEPQTRARLNRIIRNARVADTLSSKILNDATMLHRLEVQPRQNVDLIAIAESAIDRVEVAAHRNVRIEQTPGFSAIPVEAEPVALRELLANLLENALTHADRGTVVISFQIAEGVVQIRIADQGKGIPPEMREIVFERFYQGPGQGRRGTGLGLAIARTVARAFKGDILLEDNEYGGLTAVVVLPLSQTPGRGAAR